MTLERHIHRAQGGRRGFTLIELILVMTILTIAVSVTAPALANFFRGRSLDSEARRLLALTRHGQSRAVSEGLPVELWVDTAKGMFGLEVEPSFEAEDPKKVEFDLDADMKLEALNEDPLQGTVVPKLLLSQTAQRSGLTASGPHASLPKIRFLPDDTIAETSPQVLRLTDREGRSLELAQARNRLGYEIRNPVK
jgi:prepilin-type N-terminal cleavage/methylation domain-containing protein